MLALNFDADDLDDDGAPISHRTPGDALPGDCRAWHRLGVGHRCETWLAWSERFWCPAVVKLPRPHQVDHPRARRSLQREVAALDGNLHPALPRLYLDGTADAVPFLVFEHVDGDALDDEIDEHGAFAPVEVALLAAQVLAALRSVHARGLAHVDIKPANVLLREGRPVLADFGSARAIGAAQPAGKLIGSPGYAAPDLEAGQPISVAMDVYGVGITLYEALLGRAAFDPDLPASERPPLDPLPESDLAALVTAMVDTDPLRRPSPDDAMTRLREISAAYGNPAWPDWARLEGNGQPDLA
jgi:serine/threonine protein kinase